MIQSLLDRMFTHWKSSVVGVTMTTGALTVLLQSYKAGMTWKQWLVGAIPAVVGLLLRDSNKP